MSVKNFVQCGLVIPIATNTTELVLNAPVAPYDYPPLDGGTLVIADSVARPSYYEVISYTHRIDNVIYGVTRAKESTTARAWTGTAWVYQALTAADYIAALLLKANAANAALTGIPTAPTAALGTNTNQIATMAAIQAAIADLVASSPAALNTLNELATALGNDPNFAATMTTSLSGKEPSIAAGTSSQMWLGNKTWASVLSQVQGTLLTGLGAGSNVSIVSTDTLIAALAKIQNQLNNKCASDDARLSDAREWTATQVSQAEAEAGTATTDRKWTAQRVAQAVRGNILTGLNLTVSTAVAATDTLLVAVGKLQKQITDAASNLAGNVRATVLTGYVSGSNVALAATDTVLAAFGKVQAQIDAKQNSLGFTPVQQGTGTGQGSNTVKFGWSANGILLQVDATDFANSWPISITKNAATATKLATARNINGVAFDGTADITIAAGETGRMPLTGGTFTGAVAGTRFTANDWFRTTGNCGWYSETYGGGIYMSDATYVRVYNGKAFMCDGNEIVLNGVSPTLRMYDTDNAINRYVHSNGGLIGFLKGDGNWGFHNDNSGNTTSAGNLTAYSDIRLKTAIEVIPDSLMKVLQLRGVTYERVDTGERQTGVIAQEVQAVLPEAVMTMTDEQQTLSVAYGNMVGLLIEAIKELNAKVEALSNGPTKLG